MGAIIVKRSETILITLIMAGILAGVLTGTVSAHTYDPEYVGVPWTVDTICEVELGWGDEVEKIDPFRGVVYTIEVADFHVLNVTADVDTTKSDPCADRECILDPDSQYVHLRIYRDSELILSAPFKADPLSIAAYMNSPRTSATSWDRSGAIWNYEHDFFIAVDEIKCEFADDDCFCTDPQEETAKIMLFISPPPEFEFEVKTLLPDGEDGEAVDEDEFRSNSEFIAEVTIKNSGSLAYHTKTWFSAVPTEMIDGEYPPECTIQRLYQGTNADDDLKYEEIKFPKNPRRLLSQDASIDIFDTDEEITYTVYFKTPSLPKRTEYEIRVNLTCEDFKERTLYFPYETLPDGIYFDSFEDCPHDLTFNETKFEVLPVIEVKKAIGTEDYAIVSDEAAEAYTSGVTYTIYADYEPYIFLTVLNWGDYTIPSLELTDLPTSEWHNPATTEIDAWRRALPPEMIKVPDMESDRWKWDFSLSPGETMTCAYPVSILKPGSYKLGAASVHWTENGVAYNITSYAQSVEVHGPYIEVAKTVDPESVDQNDTAKITVTAKNTGDRPAAITITDQIPMASQLITPPSTPGAVVNDNSTITFKKVLKAGAEKSFEYTVDPNRTVMLPPAIVEFADITAYSGISVSEMPILYVEGTEPIGAAAEIVQSEAGSSSIPGIASAETDDPIPIDTPIRKEPGFTGIFAVLACLAAVMSGRRR